MRDSLIGIRMISDVLADAVGDIAQNQRAFPKVYDGFRDELTVVVTFMDALRLVLDRAHRDDRDVALLTAIRQGAGIAAQIKELQDRLYDDVARERAVMRFADDQPRTNRPC